MDLAERRRIQNCRTLAHFPAYSTMELPAYRHRAITGRRFQMAFSSCLTRTRHTLCVRGPRAGRGGKASCVQALQEDALHRQARGICHSRSEFVRLRWPFPSACHGKNLFRSLRNISKAPSGFRSFGKPRNLFKSNCFPLEFGKLPKPDNLGDRDWLGSITRDTGTLRSRFKFVRL